MSYRDAQKKRNESVSDEHLESIAPLEHEAKLEKEKKRKTVAATETESDTEVERLDREHFRKSSKI